MDTHVPQGRSAEGQTGNKPSITVMDDLDIKSSPSHLASPSPHSNFHILEKTSSLWVLLNVHHGHR